MASEKVTAVLFDFDMTLVDSSYGIYYCMLGKFDKLLSQCTISSQLAGAVNSVLDGMKKGAEPEEHKETSEAPAHDN